MKTPEIWKDLMFALFAVRYAVRARWRREAIQRKVDTNDALLPYPLLRVTTDQIVDLSKLTHTDIKLAYPTNGPPEESVYFFNGPAITMIAFTRRMTPKAWAMFGTRENEADFEIVNDD